MLDDLSRRDVGTLLAKVFSTAAAQNFLSGWLAAADQNHVHSADNHAPPEADRWTGYKLRFFTAKEFKNLDAYTAVLIPTDETPGAREAHVAQFVDFVVNAAAEYDPKMQQQWRSAMQLLAKNNFSELSQEEQIQLIEKWSAAEQNPNHRNEGFAEYKLIKDLTIRAFYTSRIGLIDVLEYKGIAYLPQYPGCTHPEHGNLT